ncbi:MAG: hypothetical protein Q8O62_09895 [Aequorivita sp.]|nr:hypothetical protein [Aequorivita sp.]
MVTKKASKRKKSKGLKGSTALITTETAKKAASSTANYAKNNTQTLLILLALGVGGYFVYKAVSGINKVGDTVGGIFDDGSGSPSGNTTPGGSGSSTVTVTPNQASGIARILLTAMDRTGTDTQEIYNALRGRTAADYHLISQAFGTPRYNGLMEGIWPAPPRNLTYWLTNELDSTEINKLRTIVPGIF